MCAIVSNNERDGVLSANVFSWDRPYAPLEHFFTIGSRAPVEYESGTVMVQVASNSGAGRNVGLVSAQTPLGQGRLSFVRDFYLRPATPEEIETALCTDHPEGAQFRPLKPVSMSETAYWRLLTNWNNMVGQQQKNILQQLTLGRTA